MRTDQYEGVPPNQAKDPNLYLKVTNFPCCNKKTTVTKTLPLETDYSKIKFQATIKE